MDESQDLRLLFHRLNNQLGIILSHAELLEAKSADDINRSRASLVVASVLEAMGTSREIRFRTMIATTPPAAAGPGQTVTRSRDRER